MMISLKLNDHLVNVMHKDFFNSLIARYSSLPFDRLPKPCIGVPLTAQDYDYKTYFVFRARP
jgi:hypothetical protein